jgi:hypothetical protein
VTAETAQTLALAHQPAGGFSEVGRKSGLRTVRWSKTVERSKPTETALVKLAVILEDVGLTQGETGAHGPADGHRDRGRAVCYRVEALIALAFDAIRVFAIGRCEERVLDENAGLLDGFERVRHMRGRLRAPLWVTLGASRRTLLAGLRPDERGSSEQQQEFREDTVRQSHQGSRSTDP